MDDLLLWHLFSSASGVCTFSELLGLASGGALLATKAGSVGVGYLGTRWTRFSVVKGPDH